MAIELQKVGDGLLTHTHDLAEQFLRDSSVNHGASLVQFGNLLHDPNIAKFLQLHLRLRRYVRNAPQYRHVDISKCVNETSPQFCGFFGAVNEKSRVQVV